MFLNTQSSRLLFLSPLQKGKIKQTKVHQTPSPVTSNLVVNTYVICDSLNESVSEMAP